MSDTPIRVLCVDDHRLVLEGLNLIISRNTDMQVVGAAVTGDEAVSLYRHHRPDITVMDLQLPVVSGLDAIRAIKRDDPGARIIVLTTYHGDEDIFRALQAGAATYLLKDMIADDLIRTIREVHEGRHSLDSGLQSAAHRARLTPLAHAARGAGHRAHLAGDAQQGDRRRPRHQRGDRAGARRRTCSPSSA
ncbi:MAG: response regulator transcription factor [Vicinamibacterales bacterium]